jgi:hypothetical protein
MCAREAARQSLFPMYARYSVRLADVWSDKVDLSELVPISR